MLTRRLGRTGHASSVAILGAAAFWKGDSEEAERGFRRALDAGVNHLDIAPQYGEAQRVIGPYVPPVRDRLFVACKTLRKNRDGVRAQLDESLSLLGCEWFDLYQLHAVTGLDELETRVVAMDVIVRAKDEGIVKHIGITGHDLGAPKAHAEAIRRWDVDTVMFPVNPRLWADDDYRRDAEALLELCADRDVGVMAIKAAAARPWGDRSHTATTWYEPYTSPGEIERGVRFALSIPGVHAFCTPGDVDVLPTVLATADAFDEPMTDDERAAAVAAVREEELIFPMAEKA